ncbi:MAG: SusD/RagB family nutrient-binding outer membrane lipoprotein [Carboxylicivirga sp.]|jgi:hypothetical protein|nr:SusD/RagB family nutrient-binding outer membrane lipoprotein [Carboxylicivirga sp.]
MKIFDKIKYLGLTLLMALVMLSSCEDYLDVNVDPDTPSDEQMTEAVYLPGILGYASYRGVEFAYTYSSHWMLQFAAYGYDAGGPEHFDLRPSTSDYFWSLYTQSIKNADRMLKLAEKNGNAHYAGIAKVILAHQFATLTDMFGDIPCTQALQEGVDFPTFDSQEVVYGKIIDWLNSAVTDFGKENGGVAPGSDDLLYGGNIAKWNKFANSLLARYHMRLYYRNNANGSSALAAVAKGFENAADAAKLAYAAQPNQQSYWYQYSLNWTWYGEFYPTIYFVDLLKNSSDPRLSMFFTENKDGEYVGHVSGTVSNDDAHGGKDLSRFKPFLYAQEGPSKFMSFEELKFIEVEALLHTDASVSTIQDALEAAITSDMLALGVAQEDIDTYLERDELDLSAAADDEERLEIIMMQKYIAVYMENSEPYNDWRRTGYPAFTSEIWEANMDHGGFQNTTAPLRYIYPLSSYQRNEDNTPQVDMWEDKVWWDAKN